MYIEGLGLHMKRAPTWKCTVYGLLLGLGGDHWGLYIERGGCTLYRQGTQDRYRKPDISVQDKDGGRGKKYFFKNKLGGREKGAAVCIKRYSQVNNSTVHRLAVLPLTPLALSEWGNGSICTMRVV